MANEIKLADFIQKELLTTVERNAEYYRADLQVFRRDHPELSEDRFIKARFLFDLLKEQSEGGRWSYCYHLKKDGETYQVPQASLQQLFRSVVHEEEYSGCHFFADCDEIMMLYQEMAVLMGLAAVDIRLVQDNHVNLFVPLGEGVELRMDPTTISRAEGAPLWNLPKNNYVPKGRIPEEYEKNNLTRLRKTLARRAAHLSETPLDQQIAKRLLAQSLPPEGAEKVPVISPSMIPKNWQPFVKGYGDAKDCYDRFLKQHTYSTVDDAMLALEDPAVRARHAKDWGKYSSCLEKPVPMLERLGRVFAHFTWAGFNLFEPEISTPEFVQFKTVLTSHLDTDKHRFHLETESEKTVDEKAIDEKLYLQEQFKKWQNPPFYWVRPKQDSFKTGAAILWLHEEFVQNEDNIIFLNDLVHVIEDHPGNSF